MIHLTRPLLTTIRETDESARRRRRSGTRRRHALRVYHHHTSTRIRSDARLVIWPKVNYAVTPDPHRCTRGQQINAQMRQNRLHHRRFVPGSTSQCTPAACFDRRKACKSCNARVGASMRGLGARINGRYFANLKPLRTTVPDVHVR